VQPVGLLLRFLKRCCPHSTMSTEQQNMGGAQDTRVKDMHPLLKDRLHRSRSIFSPGMRIKMNVLPMFLNIFVPWVVFIFVLGVSSFWMMYSHAGMGNVLIGLCVCFWLATVLLAINRRKYDPDPAWFSYFSFMLGVGLFSAWMLGSHIFHNYTLPYYEIKDLKVLAHMDASKENGMNVMDAGIVYFADGNKIDATRSWHFKQESVYCVAPIISGNAGSAVSKTGSFDFWVVGKDCCSESSSDFRCGAYNNPLARSGIRVLSDVDRKFYRLAVEQAETLYGVMATHPVFFEWSQDPLGVVNSWNAKGVATYAMAVIVAFVISLFGVALASCNFAFMGRSESVYGMEVHEDPAWKQGGYRATA